MNYPELEKCIQTIKRLRDPVNGCPWDLEQTHESLLKYLIEEAYEFKDAVLKKDFKEMKNEIGDILLQVLLHTTIAEESKQFDLESVALNLSDKMVRRHPHVFKNHDPLISKEKIIEEWESIKAEENKEKKINNSPIPEKLLHAPSLQSAHLIGVASNKINFDWKTPEEVFMKVKEEWNELEVAIKNNSVEQIEEELGDLLFSIAQWGRHKNLNSEVVLEKANKKFIRRFRAVEKMAEAKQKKINELTQAEMEELWKMVKMDEQS